MTRAAPLLTLLTLLPPLGGCPREVAVEDRLVVAGALDRESIFGSLDGTVDVDYASESARGEWWPCDLRLTALGCVGDHHVNVFLSRAGTDFGAVGGAGCVQDGVPDGVLEELARRGAGTFDVGADFNAFIVVASDVDDEPGAIFDDDIETTAATRLGAGTLEVVGASREGITLVMDAETPEGGEVHVEFAGTTSIPQVVPTLEGPSTCVAGALVES